MCHARVIGAAALIHEGRRGRSRVKAVKLGQAPVHDGASAGLRPAAASRCVGVVGVVKVIMMKWVVMIWIMVVRIGTKVWFMKWATLRKVFIRTVMVMVRPVMVVMGTMVMVMVVGVVMIMRYFDSNRLWRGWRLRLFNFGSWFFRFRKFDYLNVMVVMGIMMMMMWSMMVMMWSMMMMRAMMMMMVMALRSWKKT